MKHTNQVVNPYGFVSSCLE